MKLLKLLKSILKENSTDTYNYGCVMLYFDFPQMSDLHSIIDKSDVYTESEDKSYGLEDKPHCTLLYGLHDTVSLSDVKLAINTITFGDCKIYNPSLFTSNKKYDVLKFDVAPQSKGRTFLTKAHMALKKYPYTSDFPDYEPHMTIAYIKSGLGSKYVDKLIESGITEFVLTPTHAVYSEPNGKNTRISILIS